MTEADAWRYEHPDFGVEVHLTRWGSATGGRFDDFIGWNETPLFLSTADLQARLDAAEAKNAEMAEALDKCRCIIKYHVKNAGACCTMNGEVFSALDAYAQAVEALARTQGETP